MISGLVHNPYGTIATRPAAVGLASPVHAWRTPNGVFWQRSNGNTGAMIGQPLDFAALYDGYPVGLAVQSTNDPAFSFRPANGVTVAAAKWIGGALGQAKPMVDCDDGMYAPLDLDGTNQMHVVCPTDFPALPAPAINKIRLYQELGANMVPTTIFDNKEWRSPDLKMLGDDAIVAAYNATDRRIEVRWQDGINGLQPAIVLMTLPAGERIATLALDARETAEGFELAVVARADNDRVYYAERNDDGNVSVRRRADVFSESEPDCNGADFMKNNVDVLLPNADEAWLNWQIEFSPDGVLESVVTSRFTAFRRADQTDNEPRSVHSDLGDM